MGGAVSLVAFAVALAAPATTAAWSSWPDGATSCSGAVRVHGDRPQRLTLICLFACFQGLQSQEEEYSPHRKKKEQEIVQKGMMK